MTLDGARDRLGPIVDDVDDDCLEAHLQLSVGGIETALENESSRAWLLEDVLYHLEQADDRLEDSGLLHDLRQVSQLVQAERDRLVIA